jgi:hypothetical protein
MSYASEFLSNLIISKFASVLGSFNMVESSDQLSEELLSDKLLKDDVAYLTRTISPNIPFIGLISGGCTTAKHVVAHKWSKSEDVSEEAKHMLLHTESQLGEPYDWGNSWDGTEFEDIIDELIKKTYGHDEKLSILQEKLDGLKYDFETFKITIKMITNIYKNLHDINSY